MIDYRSIEDLQVFRDNLHVANLRRVPKGCEFRYTDEFLTSGQTPIALHLPTTKEGLRVEGLANLPTYFAGLLPEGVMFSAVKNLIGSSADDLFAVLAATGADAIGDIDVRVPGNASKQPTIDLAEAAELIKSILERKGPNRVEAISAISGVQPKLSIGEIVRASRKAAYIAKFESPEFAGLIENEFACMQLAKKSRLSVAQTKLQSNVLIVTRFDRVYLHESKQAEELHVEDMLQVMDLFPNSKYSLDYLELMTAMSDLGVSKAALLDALKLYVFSYLIGNGDLHAKNVSLIQERDSRQWRLSPAYDLLSTLPYASLISGADRMALALFNDSYGRFTVEEFVEFGLLFDLPEKAVKNMIARTSSAVLKHAGNSLHASIPAQAINTIVARAESLQA